MIITAVINSKKFLEYDIPENHKEAFEADIERHFIGKPIPVQMLKRWCSAKGIKLVPTY